MKHLPSDKYTVAWFKLAECVSRGEKQRALGVYRLLSHSIDDYALARQLEADILLSFNDECALEKYHEAAQLYKQSHRVQEAIAVCEHLCALAPESFDYLIDLIQLYKQLSKEENVMSLQRRLFDLFIAKKMVGKACKLLEQMTSIGSDFFLHGQEKILFMLLEKDEVPHDQIVGHVKKMVDEYLRHNDNQALQKFLAKLKAVNLSHYAGACQYIERVMKS